MSEPHPNVVLICVDQWRGDCLSIAGHPVVQTPYLDLLALQGVRFNRAYTATPSCVAARAALLTGLAQRHHGRVGYRDGVPWNYDTTLAGEFTRHGYQTQAVGKMHVYPERSRMGFDHVELHDGYGHHWRKRGHDLERVDDYLPWLRQRAGHDADYYQGIHCNSYVVQPWTMDERLHPTNYVTTQSVDFLRRRDPTKPFFLFMSYHRPHPPLDPPPWAFEQYIHRDMPDPPVGDWADIFESFHQPFHPMQPPKRMDSDALRRARAGYYGHLSHIDHQISRFLEILDEYGLAESTWVCFVSDHGDMLGDHHLFAKSVPYEGSARVPLILTSPRGDSSLTAGAAIDPVVELRDIMPTLLDCAGLPAPEGIDGRSFLPLARGEQIDWRAYLHGEHTAFGGSIHYVTNGRYKYLWHSRDGREQLFDLDQDPQELHDLVGAAHHRSMLEQLRGALIHELDGREEGFTDGKHLIPGRSVTNVLSHLLDSK